MQQEKDDLHMESMNYHRNHVSQEMERLEKSEEEKHDYIISLKFKLISA